MAALREFFTTFADLPSGTAGRGDCESLFARLRNKATIAQQHLAPRLLGIQQSLDTGRLDNVYWLPGPENPSDGPTKVKCCNLDPFAPERFVRCVA